MTNAIDSHAQASAPIQAPAGADISRFANARDLGGLPIGQTQLTRRGVLYRSDAPWPGDSAPQDLPAWPPTAVLDLRTPGEVSHDHPLAGGPAAIHKVPLLDTLTNGARRSAEDRAPNGRGIDRGGMDGLSLGGLYLRILDTVPDRLASLVGLAADAEGPVLVHCAAGKDRVAVAVLLLAVGVRPDAVIADYVLTDANMELFLRRIRTRGSGTVVESTTDVPADLLRAPVEAITPVVEALVDWAGGISGWLIDHGAQPTDIARWRDRFVTG